MEMLTLDEIRAINQSSPFGRRLNENKLYLKWFLINDRQNQAADPEPFKVHPGALDKIASSAVGRPFIVGPNPNKHVRGATGDPGEIIKVQQHWAIGEMVRHMINAVSRNAYAVVEIFDEFADEVRQGRVRGASIPPYSSPLVEVFKTNAQGEITDGRILHLQAVGQPGYDPAVAKLVGACEGMLGDCMRKLRALGASGALKTYQAQLDQEGLENNSLGGNVDNDKLEPTMEKGNTSTGLTKDDVAGIMASALADFEKKHESIFGAAGSAATQALEEKSRLDQQGNQATSKKIAPKGKNPEGETAAQEARTEPDLAKVASDIDSIRAELEEERKKRLDAEENLSKKERLDMINKIVEGEVQLHLTPLAKRKDRVEHYLKLKNKDGSPRDLSLLMEHIELQKGRTVGASGSESEFPGLHLGASGGNGNDAEEAGVDHFAVYESIRRSMSK